MLKSFIHLLLARRHFWRHVSFDELAELYASRMMRALASGMIAIFVTIYLYQLGYSLQFIVGYSAIAWLVAAAYILPSSHIIAAIGPKHAILYSNLLYIPAMIALLLVPQYGLWAIAVYTLLQPFSFIMFDAAHNIDFSKVKHIDHTGKELGFMYVIEKLGTGLSPLLGGVIASLFGPQFAIGAAMTVFALAAMPLFFTGEPLSTHQRISFRGFSFKFLWRQLASGLGRGIDSAASFALWPLYLAVVVFTGATAYAQIGAVTSITLLAALVISRIYGLLIDHRRGRQLLNVGVIGNSALHLVRPFVTTPGTVVATNIANEAFTTGYNMPYLKGMYDAADSADSQRIAYIAIMQIAFCLGAAIFLGVIWLVSFWLNGAQLLQVGFVLAGMGSLLLLAQNFRALR